MSASGRRSRWLWAALSSELRVKERHRVAVPRRDYRCRWASAGPEKVVTPAILAAFARAAGTCCSAHRLDRPGAAAAHRNQRADMPRSQHTDVGNYGWATLVHVTLRKIPSNPGAPNPGEYHEVNRRGRNRDRLPGAPAAHLNTAGEARFEQIQLLYRPSQTSDAAQGLQSEANGDYVMALVKGNLSTEPTRLRLAHLPLAFEALPRNTLNTIYRLYRAAVAVQHCALRRFYLTTTSPAAQRACRNQPVQTGRYRHDQHPDHL